MTKVIDTLVERIIKNGNASNVFFPKELFAESCITTNEILNKEQIFPEINGETLVVGDIHGNLDSLIKIVREGINFLRNGKNIVFLGDYVDRGPYSIECLMIIQYLKRKYPNQVFLGRGNHEGVGVRYSNNKGFKRAPFQLSFPISNNGECRYSLDERTSYSSSRELLEFYDNLSAGFSINGNCAFHGGFVKNFSKYDIIVHAIESVLGNNRRLRKAMNLDFEFFLEYYSRAKGSRKDPSNPRFTFKYIINNNRDLIEYLLNPNNIVAKRNVLRKIGNNEKLLNHFKRKIEEVIYLKNLMKATNFLDIFNCIKKPWFSETVLSCYILWSNLKITDKLYIQDNGRIAYNTDKLSRNLREAGFSGIIVGHDHGSATEAIEMDEFKKIISFPWPEHVAEVGIVSENGKVEIVSVNNLKINRNGEVKNISTKNHKNYHRNNRDDNIRTVNTENNRNDNIANRRNFKNNKFRIANIKNHRICKNNASNSNDVSEINSLNAEADNLSNLIKKQNLTRASGNIKTKANNNKIQLQ